MRKLRYVLAGILMLGLAFPVMTLADDDDDSDRRRCSNIGTWFGVVGPEDSTLTGVFWTVIGKSENYGTNIVEQLNRPTPSILDLFPGAVQTSSVRGDWHRTSNTTFAYTMTGYSVDVDGNMVGIVKFKGNVEMYDDCEFAYVTAKVDIYYPPNSPFADNDNPDIPDFPFPGQWARRTHVELP